MAGATPLDYASLLASIGGSVGNGVLQSVDANNALAYKKKQDEMARFTDASRYADSQNQQQQQDVEGRLNLADNLRKTLTQPTSYDFLSAMAKRYGSG